MTVKKVLFSGVGFILLLVVAGAIGLHQLGFRFGTRTPPGLLSPAPNASEAPKASASGKVAADSAKCDWPSNFKLPKDIQLEIPDVPDTIRRPAPDENK